MKLTPLLRAFFLSLTPFIISATAHAQGCSLCYTQAAAAGARMIHALRGGILVLIIPPLFLSVGITVLAYRKRNQFRDIADASQEDEF